MDQWYLDRDPARIVPSALLVDASDLSDLSDALDAAVFLPPSDTNAIAFASFSLSPSGVPSGWLWSPLPGRAHAVFRKHDLRSPAWAPALGLVSDGALAVWSDTPLPSAAPTLRSPPSASAPASAGFYAAAEVETDTDGDGLPDGMERLAYGSSPYLSDSDGDGLSDGEEVGRHGSSPALADTNGDGLQDGIAVRRLLDPVSDDFDGDGVSDADELLLHGTDPRAANTDGDGLSDADEILVHGSSPFVEDTDGDGLSDRKEVEESGSSPLLLDTDGDGIDDHSEWQSYGLDPADPADGAQDGDGDGFSNAEEFAWGWSLASAASSNATPRTRLLVCQAGEEPVFKAITSDSVLALGCDAGRGTRIRIPKSVQLGTGTIGRTLRWTSGPGLHLGDTSLSTDGALAIPDEDTEIVAWGLPSDGGAESTLRLVDALGRTNATLRIRLPALSGARLYLSSVPGTQTFHTNLVAGVPGVVCIPSDDPLYGRPRAWLDPQCSPDSSTGHRSLEHSGHLLARVSGATPARTLPLDVRRPDGAWGSSSGPRGGIALVPGLSRIEAGIDFSLDGALDPDEIAVSCDVYVVPVRLTADTDRDGAVTPADRDGRDRWTPSRGALLAPDRATYAVDGYRPPDDRPLAPLVVHSTGLALPDGWSMRLATSAPSGMRLYREGVAGWFSLAGGTTNGLGGIAASDVSLRLSDEDPDGAVAFETTVSLELRHNGRTFGTDTVALRHAPLIVPWNTLPIRALYTAAMPDGSLRFPPEVEPARQRCFPTPGAHWVQDMMQMTAVQLDETAGGASVAVDLERPMETNFVDLLPAGVGNAYGDFLGYVRCANNGDGGNIEATPPLPGYPFGRLLTGVGKYGTTRPCAAVRMLERQGLQGPAITVPVGWLAVGHVDEVCCFVDDRTVLVPSPRLAFDLIAEQVRLHHGNYTNTFVWGDDPTNYIHRIQDVLFPTVISSNWTDSIILPSDISFSGPDHGYQIDQLFYSNGEVMAISNVVRSNGSVTVYIDRACLGTSAQTHLGASPLCRLSNIAVINRFDSANGRPLASLQRIREILGREVPGVNIIEVPVLFKDKTSSTFVAGSVNMANALVSEGLTYMTEPGCDLFRNAVPLQGKVFIGGANAWEFYHCLMGELHCGSEADRIFPPSKPFWETKEFDAWPFDRKGATP